MRAHRQRFDRLVSTQIAALAILTALAFQLAPPVLAADPPFDHSSWGEVLERFVDQRGFVDYRALSSERKVFDRYMERIEEVSPDSNPSVFASREHELAYWINAYNAQVFLGVLDLGTDIDSVWDGGLISGRKFFVKRDIVLGGKGMNLKGLEDDIIRGRYRDPRIHAALNCASISCPRLPRETFSGDRLDRQLDEAMTGFVNDSRHVKIDRRTKEIFVSKIFDWFDKDFLEFEQRQGNRSPDLIDYINRFRKKDDQLPEDWDIEFLDYDKGLNRQ